MRTKSQVKLPGLNHRLVLELDKRRVRELALVVVLSALMLVPLLVYVWQNVAWIQRGYQVEQLKSQRDRLIEVNHKLRLERASLQNLARVEGAAVEQLGLQQPPGGTVLMVKEGRVRRLPAERVPAKMASAAGSAPRDDHAASRDAN